MIRDWEIIRAILIKLESSSTPNARLNMNQIEGHDPQTVAYHMRLLKDAGCIEASIRDSSTGDNLIIAASAKTLTTRGHDLLDALRNKHFWNKIKEVFREKSMDMTIEGIFEVAKSLAKVAVTTLSS